MLKFFIDNVMTSKTKGHVFNDLVMHMHIQYSKSEIISVLLYIHCIYKFIRISPFYVMFVPQH